MLRSHDARNASSPSRVFQIGLDRFVECNWKPSRCFASYQQNDSTFAVARRCTSSKAGAKSESGSRLIVARMDMFECVPPAGTCPSVTARVGFTVDGETSSANCRVADENTWKA